VNYVVLGVRPKQLMLFRPHPSYLIDN